MNKQNDNPCITLNKEEYVRFCGVPKQFVTMTAQCSVSKINCPAFVPVWQQACSVCAALAKSQGHGRSLNPKP